MKLLFVARHFTYFRNFESVIRELAAHGHSLHLAAERDDAIGGVAQVEKLASGSPRVTFGEAPAREADEWAPLAARVRLAFDYVRYLDPMYDGTPRLRSRAAERAPEFAVRFGDSAWARCGPARAIVRAGLRRVESALPGSSRIEAYLREQKPDALLITPLIGVVSSPQPDYVRAARALGIASALCVWSWDHLSSKALIRDVPDRVMVWNEVQRDEAVRLHRVPADRIVVTGAQCFDQWFDRQPSRTRQEFCAQAGLDADRPYVLYVGSALFGGSPSEAAFVMRWIAHLRTSRDARVREANVLVRPHPQRMKEWDGIDVSATPGVAVRSGNPVTDAARADYFDSLAHSAAVVGLNTSAFLEAAIAKRPVLAILPPEFRDNQEGTIHFHYLTRVGGGLLRISRTLEEHVRQLSEILPVGTVDMPHAEFLQAFVRPRGLDQPATPVFAQAVESLAGLTVRARRRNPSPIARALLNVVRKTAESPKHRHWLMDEEDRRVHAWRETKAQARAAQRRADMSGERPVRRS